MRHRPRRVVADHQPDHDRGADAGGVAGGEVDLAEQQDEDQAHGDEDRAGALGEHVAEVEQAVERRAGRCEKNDGQHDQAGDGGQRAHVAAAHALDVQAHVVAGAAGDRRGAGDRGELVAVDGVGGGLGIDGRRACPRRSRR